MISNERFREIERKLWDWIEEDHRNFIKMEAVCGFLDGLIDLVQSMGLICPEWTEKCPQILADISRETEIPHEEIIYYLKTAPWYPWEMLDPSDFEEDQDESEIEQPNS